MDNRTWSDYAYPFAAWDVRLYLDTHPDDAQALETYRSLCQQAQDAGMPCGGFACTVREQGSSAGWTWISDPWPWEPDANIVSGALCGCSDAAVPASSGRNADSTVSAKGSCSAVPGTAEPANVSSARFGCGCGNPCHGGCSGCGCNNGSGPVPVGTGSRCPGNCGCVSSCGCGCCIRPEPALTGADASVPSGRNASPRTGYPFGRSAYRRV